jgi:hypothetical protein
MRGVKAINFRAGSEPLWQTFPFKEFHFFESTQGVEAACVSGGGIGARYIVWVNSLIPVQYVPIEKSAVHAFGLAWGSESWTQTNLQQRGVRNAKSA